MRQQTLADMDVDAVRLRLLAWTLHGASLAQSETRQDRLVSACADVLGRVEQLVMQLRSALVAEEPRLAGVCPIDAAEAVDLTKLTPVATRLLDASQLAERMQLEYLLAKPRMPLPGPHLVTLYTLTLKA